MSSLTDRCHEYVTLPISGRRVCLWCEAPETADPKVTVVRWANVVLEQQGRDRQAQQ